MKTTQYYLLRREGRGLMGLGKRRWWFVIRHNNGRTVLTSETYSSSQARDDSANNLIRCWPALNDHPITIASWPTAG